MDVCRSLAQYQPLPMSNGKRPQKTYLISARRGLPVPTGECDGAGQAPGGCVPAMGEANGWESGNKPGYNDALPETPARMLTSFGSSGWEALVGADLETRVVDADHFSMMAPPHAAVTGGLIREAVEECCAL